MLVPLCGKAEDLAFLASRGHEVIGVELVEDAVQAFFAEHGVTPRVTRRGEVVEYASDGITIYAGDIFAISREHVGAIDAIYDRAAIVALPEDMRARYVAHLRALAPVGTRILVVTLEYAQDLASGPPFAVHEAELRRLYAGAASIELLDEAPWTRENFPPATDRMFAITL